MPHHPPADNAASPPRPPVVILVEPQLGENIGAAARAMANFGLEDLRLVAPRDPWPNDRAVAAASGADGIVAAARVFPSLQAAIGDLHYLCATTARARDMVKPVHSPETAARMMLERSRGGQNCGVLFGRERSGLDNDQVALADAIVMIPVNPAFASLNLAQSVLLVGYEWLKQGMVAGLGRQTPFDGPGREGLALTRTRPATKAELLGFFGHIESELDQSGFLHPPEKRPVMVRGIRNMFQRMAATEQDVRTLRGIVSSLVRAHQRRPKS